MGLYTVLKPCLKGENTNITKNNLKHLLWKELLFTVMLQLKQNMSTHGLAKGFMFLSKYCKESTNMGVD